MLRSHELRRSVLHGRAALYVVNLEKRFGAYGASLAHLLQNRSMGSRRDLCSSVSGDSRYIVRIKTGNRRGSGTSASVFVQLLGKHARTQRVEVDGSFARNSVVENEIVAPVQLGKLRGLLVGHDNFGEVGVGWFLDSVEVQDLCKPEVKPLMFPVQRWLGKSDIGFGEYPRMIRLRVGITDSMSDPSGSTRFESTSAPVKISPLTVKTGAAGFPHPDKVRAGERAIVRSDVGQAGEDAFSISPVRHPDSLGVKSRPSTVTIAVCDGVFAWRDKGIDPGEWSRFLVRTIRHQSQHHVKDCISVDEQIEAMDWVESYRLHGLEPPSVPLPHPSAMMALAEAKIRQTSIQGSSTVCIVSIHGIDSMGYVACLGDSGVCIYREPLGIIFRTPEQEHEFGYPFQLGHHEASDTSKNALISHCRLSAGDVVIVASDGLYDNLDEDAICEIVKSHLSAKNAQLCANDLATAAFRNSVDVSGLIDTPFSKTAAEEYNLAWHGGKKDDITVVCAFTS